jgi:hypothetical protein
LAGTSSMPDARHATISKSRLYVLTAAAAPDPPSRENHVPTHHGEASLLFPLTLSPFYTLLLLLLLLSLSHRPDLNQSTQPNLRYQPRPHFVVRRVKLPTWLLRFLGGINMKLVLQLHRGDVI